MILHEPEHLLGAFKSLGYSARESVLDVLVEMLEWFDRYVKNKK